MLPPTIDTTVTPGVTINFAASVNVGAGIDVVASGDVVSGGDVGVGVCVGSTQILFQHTKFSLQEYSILPASYCVIIQG